MVPTGSAKCGTRMGADVRNRKGFMIDNIGTGVFFQAGTIEIFLFFWYPGFLEMSKRDPGSRLLFKFKVILDVEGMAFSFTVIRTSETSPSNGLAIFFCESVYIIDLDGDSSCDNSVAGSYTAVSLSHLSFQSFIFTCQRSLSQAPEPNSLFASYTYIKSKIQGTSKRAQS